MVRIRPKHGVRDVLLGAKDNPRQRSGENGTLSGRVRLDIDTNASRQAVRACIVYNVESVKHSTMTFDSICHCQTNPNCKL